MSEVEEARPTDVELLLAEIGKRDEILRAQKGVIERLTEARDGYEAALGTCSDQLAECEATIADWVDHQDAGLEPLERYLDAVDGAGPAPRVLLDLIARMLPLVNHRYPCPMETHRSDGEECSCGAIEAAREARALVGEVTS